MAELNGIERYEGRSGRKGGQDVDYHKCAQEIYDLVGKKENVVSAAHCATRLRLVLSDDAKCDSAAIEEVDGVKGVFSASGQLQIILGTGVVNKVYDEFIKIGGITAATKDEAKAAAAQKGNWFKQAIKTLGDIFVPIIPAIVASGFLMGIMEALNFMVANDYIHIDTSGSIYVFAKIFSNVAYTFMPILIGYSCAKVFGGNVYLGAVIGMIMISPDLQNAWTVATEGVQQTQEVFFGLYSIDMVGYQGHVIPIMIAVWIMCFLEKRLHKVVPAMLDLFVTPLVSVFVTGYLALAVIGPVFVAIENGFLGAIQAILTVPYGIGSLIVGAVYPLTVVMGIHHMYTIIDLGQLAAYGLTFWLPLASSANLGQGAATLAVAIKSKKAKLKSVAFPSALSCFMGITEPAIFGVNLRFVKPLVCGMIGGGLGAMYASIVSLGASGTGVTGIFGLLLCLQQPVHYLIMMAISVGSAFVLTWFFGYKDEAADPAKEKKKAAAEEAKVAGISDPVVVVEPYEVYAPITGNVIASQDIPDPTFAAGVLGEGVGIEPDAANTVVAPFNGEISSVTDTRHAVGITSPEGIELLIHVGVDTVAMNGEGFECFVEEGQKVTAGTPLITFDREKIAKAGHPDVVVVLVTNSDDYEGLKIRRGHIEALKPMLHVEAEQQPEAARQAAAETN